MHFDQPGISPDNPTVLLKMIRPIKVKGHQEK